MTTEDKERFAETVIQEEIGIKPGTSLLTPMDYGECVRCIMTALSTEHERAQQELQAYRDKLKELEEYFNLAEQAKQVLRSKGYGWTGLDILETCKMVPSATEE